MDRFDIVDSNTVLTFPYRVLCTVLKFILTQYGCALESPKVLTACTFVRRLSCPNRPLPPTARRADVSAAAGAREPVAAEIARAVVGGARYIPCRREVRQDTQIPSERPGASS